MKPGLLVEALQLMKTKHNQLKDVEALAVITFDEVYISNKIEIERRRQEVYDPHKSYEVVMVRGLMGHWKRPIYYQFDTPMKKEILFKIITEVKKNGYSVVAATCDLDGTNRSLWKDLALIMTGTASSIAKT